MCGDELSRTPAASVRRVSSHAEEVPRRLFRSVAQLLSILCVEAAARTVREAPVKCAEAVLVGPHHGAFPERLGRLEKAGRHKRCVSTAADACQVW